MKKISIPVLLTITLLIALFAPFNGYALSEAEKIEKQLKELKKQQQAAARKAKEAEQLMQNIKVQKGEAKEQLNVLWDQIDQTSNELHKLLMSIESIEQDLQKASQQLDNAIARVDERDEFLQERLRLMYMNGFVDYMDVLMSSTSFSDFLDRYDSIKSLVAEDRELLEKNQKDRDLIDEKKQQIAKRLKDVKALYAKTEQLQDFLEQKEKKKEVLIASLNEKEHELEDVSEEQERLLMELAKKEQKLLAEKNKLKTYYKGGKLGYPLKKQYPVTSAYGYRIHPIKKTRKLHTGIDFGAPGGASILAAESGTVIVSQSWGGYGETIIIDHGKDLWTLYAHMRSGSRQFSKGDTVKRGQVIGSVGTTGSSTGNHLHFEVRVNGEPVNPSKYLK